MPTIDEQQIIISTLFVEFKELKGVHGLTHTDTVAKKDEFEAQVIVLDGLRESVLSARYVASGFTTTTGG